MKNYLLLICACLLAQLAVAQTFLNRALMIGPAIASDGTAYKSGKSTKGISSYGRSVGIDGSYRINRLLYGAKLLYTNRPFEQTFVLYDPGFSPNLAVSRVQANMMVLSVPVTVSYQLVSGNRLQWFLGGGLASEFLLGTNNVHGYAYNGEEVSRGLIDLSLDGHLRLGFTWQTSFRYLITPNVGLQLESAIRVYALSGFPGSTPATAQANATASVLVRL